MAHSFFELAGENYGHNAKTQLKIYADCNAKLSNMVTRRDFLVLCRRHGVFPAHIQNTMRCVFPLLEERSPYTRKLHYATQRFKKSVLNIEIQHTCYKIQLLNRQLNEVSHRASSLLPPEVWETFQHTQLMAGNHRVRRLADGCQRKFQRILHNMSDESAAQPNLNEKAILNATSVEIPAETLTLLSLGPKFALPHTSPRHMPIYHLLADVENILHTNPDPKIRDTNRCLIANHIQNNIRNPKPQHNDPVTNFCITAGAKTRKFVKDHPDICVLQSDKGNRTVIMMMEDYNQKMLRLVGDTNTYSPLGRDPTSGLQRNANEIVKRMLDMKLIDERKAKQLKCRGATCPGIYGQPKAHKADLPLRPVVPNTTAPTRHLAKFLSGILKLAVHDAHNVRDSFSFAAEINTVTLPEGHVLVSFDVVSLFTNIPKELVIYDIIQNWDVIGPVTDVNLDMFLEMVEFCLNSSYFSFQSKVYLQLFGTAMGSSLSPILADLVLNILIANLKRRLNFEIPLLKKYVDDLLLALPENQVENTLKAFNQYNPNIQFTMEKEVDRRIPYLDTVVIRRPDQSLATDWYAKPIASGRLLSFCSFHPIQLKMNVAYNFAQRVVSLSTTRSQTEIKNTIFRQLKLNCYPAGLINRIINRTLQQQQPPQQPDTNTPTTAEPKQFFSIPYIQSLSPAITKTIQRDYPHVQIAYTHTNTVGSFFTKVKDSVAPLLQSNVIYRIPCNSCQQSYIGMTTLQLRERLYGHQSDLNRLQLLSTAGHTSTDPAMVQLRERTALVEHCIDQNHRFGLQKTEIVDRSFKPWNLQYLEMFHIVNTEGAVNRRTDVDRVSGTYQGILQTVKNMKRLSPPNPNIVTHPNTQNITQQQ